MFSKTYLSPAKGSANGKKDSKKKVRSVPSGRRGFSGEQQKDVFWAKELLLEVSDPLFHRSHGFVSGRWSCFQ